ncbi:MAG: pimeloyl-ACP methyl ester carboxylesterase [Akkermansiaceae bacterium]
MYFAVEKNLNQAPQIMLLSYSTRGLSTSEPLLFLHGLGAGKKQSTSGLPHLENTHLIAPDLPGHGDSTSFDPATYSFDSFADHVIALMDHLGLEKCHLGGLSMGSGITLNIALRYPDRFKKLILLRPSWLDSPQPAHLKLVADAGEMPQAEFEALPQFQILLAHNPPVANSITGVYQRPDNAVLSRMWNSAPFHSLSDLKNITAPALVMSSPRDDLHPESVASAIANSLPNSQLTTLPARYHEPEAYQKSLNQHLNQFLNS